MLREQPPRQATPIYVSPVEVNSHYDEIDEFDTTFGVYITPHGPTMYGNELYATHLTARDRPINTRTPVLRRIIES